VTFIGYFIVQHPLLNSRPHIRLALFGCAALAACVHAAPQLAPNTNAQTLIGNGAGRTANVARRAALAELSSQLSAQIQSTCKDRIATLARGGLEQLEESSQCDVVISTQTSALWGDWIQLAQCTPTAANDAITMTCRLDRAQFAQTLKRRLATPWAQYIGLAASMNAQQQTSRTASAQQRATWIAAYHRAGTLRAQMHPLLDGLFILNQSPTEQRARLQADTRAWEKTAQSLRHQHQLKFRLEGEQGLQRVLMARGGSILTALGLRHAFDAQCESTKDDAISVLLTPQIACRSNPSGHSICGLEIAFATRKCQTQTQRTGLWSAPFEGRDYAGNSEEAKRLVQAQLKTADLKPMLRTLLFEEVPIP
jgi:hypothetical protein